MTIHTTSNVGGLKKAGKDAAKYLGEDVVWKRVKLPQTVPLRVKLGKTYIDPLWLSAFLNGADALHITPFDRRRLKLTPTINGNATKLRGIPHFYIVASPTKKARGYPFSEVTRLILHEHMHAKAPSSVVHYYDYEKKAIHELAETFIK